MPNVNIQALQITAETADEEWQICNLDPGAAQNLGKAKEDRFPTVYIICMHDLAILSAYPDIFINRGRKNKHKGLSEYLLGLRNDKIPFIDGNYAISRQLRRSIRDLLVRAHRIGDKNIYIIGVNEKLLKEIWQKSYSAKKEKSSHEKYMSARHPFSETDIAPSIWLLHQLKERIKEPPELSQRYIGQSLAAQIVRKLILHAASSNDPVLILGDTGTGKELIAREIHGYSPRQNDNFVPVNCGAIPQDLFEAELFGFRKGAFTHAFYNKKGMWETAGNGTLFLDEIGDLHPHHQVKILRALEENKIWPIGAEKEVTVNARIIAATNRDLYSMVQTGDFREDLYYRLRGFFIRTPLLRDHPEDIPNLAQSLWKKITHDSAKFLPEDIVIELQSFRWPGNARELKMVLNNMRSLFGTEGLGLDHLKAVFYLQGHSTRSKEQATPENAIIFHRAECLNHLKQVDEVLQAIRITFLPMIEDKKISKKTIGAITASLLLHLSELEMLTNRPLLFYSEVCSTTANRFKGKLAYFRSLLQDDLIKAQQYWNDDLAEEFKEVNSILFKEVEKLLEKV